MQGQTNETVGEQDRKTEHAILTLLLRDLDKPTARRWALGQPRANVLVARTMFTDAINDGFHPGPNPFGNLRLEQPRGRKDLTALSEDELSRLADCALDCLGSFGPTFRAMILFAAYVGLRPGELYALERRDVMRDEVEIRQNLDSTGQLKEPKNGLARRVILPPPAREALADVPARVDAPWLFTTPRGQHFSKGSHLYYWRPVRTAFGRPRCTSTSYGTSALRTCSNLASPTPTWRFSSATPTGARS